MTAHPGDNGGVMLLAVSDSAASLWTVASRADEGVCPLGDAALRAWKDASYALSRSLPLVWAAIDAAVAEPPAARPLALLARPGHVAEPPIVLDGASLGLSFVIEQGARVLGLPAPADLAASAEIDAWGALLGVRGLAEKARVLARRAPSRRRLVVAAGQDEGVEEALALGLEVIPVKRVADALDLAFPRLTEALGASSTGASRSMRTAAFYRLALAERAAMVDWTPVANAALALLDAWAGELDATDTHLLRFAYAVAHRHQGGRATLDLPDEAWLLAQPSPLRQRHVAQVVQHAADTGSPSAEAARALALRHVPADQADRFPEHLEILGALARLDAVTGCFEAALGRQLELARAFLARNRVGSMTFQLAEAFRLAGALGDGAAFDAVVGLVAAAERAGDLDAHAGRVYVELAWGRAEVLLGRDAGLDRLEQLSARPGVPAHVVASALRWCLAAQRCDPASIRVRLDALTRRNDRAARHGARAQLLIALDEATLAGEVGDAKAAIAALSALEPEPLGLLLTTRDAGRWPDEGDYVRRFYPY